jgi:predicted Rossmann fold nucleotide-binding protein DprA/Smf involved in DNA uptake
MNPTIISSTDAEYPRRLHERLGEHAPSTLNALGDFALLKHTKTGLFCSVQCPGDKILAAHDIARRLRDDGTAVISGFHSPVEKECLRILLQGKQPVVIGLARSLVKIRLPSAWRPGLESGRLLLLSPFERRPRRPDKKSARRRNELVAALADEVLIIHAEPGGQIHQLLEMVDRWKIPRRELG